VASSDRARGVVLATCIGAFCVAMGLRAEVSVWIGTGTAASLSVVLLWFGARPSAQAVVGPKPFAGALAGVAVGVAMSFATWGLYPVAVDLLPAVRGEVETLYGLLRQPPGPVRAFPLLLLVVAAEELVWRGLAVDVLSPRFGRWCAVVMAALLYVLPQVAFRSPLLVVIALLCGLVWGALRARTEGLAAPFLAHLVWDVLVFIAYPVA
jgi:membrane protease YdiL (CAAX protease family)